MTRNPKSVLKRSPKETREEVKRAALAPKGCFGSKRASKTRTGPRFPRQGVRGRNLSRQRARPTSPEHFFGDVSFFGRLHFFWSFGMGEAEIWGPSGGCRPQWVMSAPFLKITRSVLTSYENSLLYLIPKPLTRNSFWPVVIEFHPRNGFTRRGQSARSVRALGRRLRGHRHTRSIPAD
jgi:hypothetical protein